MYLPMTSVVFRIGCSTPSARRDRWPSTRRPESFCSVLVREANLDFARTMLGAQGLDKRPKLG